MSEAAAEDRISNFPDCILHHVHSFLGIKHGARTSVLSKRWNYIWTTVPTLHFWNRYNPLFSRTSAIKKFMDFVDGTLHRHSSSNVNKFSLDCNHHLNEKQLLSWISTVVRGNIRELRLSLKQKITLFLPPSLFSCISLISLELVAQSNIRLPKCISFPNLKRLRLVGFEFSDECWNEELFSNSHALEELILDNCTASMKCFCISIPTLKLLKICTWFMDQRTGFRGCVLKIDAPRLATFYYINYVAKEFVLSGFPTLVEAEVYFNFQKKDGAAIRMFLQSLAHVKCLTVCDETLKAICFAYDLSNNLLTFPNVKMLKISNKVTADHRLIFLLKAVPNLESLVFVEYMDDVIEVDGDEDYVNERDDYENDEDDDNEYDDGDSIEGQNSLDNEDEGDISDVAESLTAMHGQSGDTYHDEDDIWAPDTLTNGCLFPHLKLVCFQKFLGNPREMRWVKLILTNAKALQTMNICYYDPDFFVVNVKSEKEVMEEIPSVPRASAGCVFKFSSEQWRSLSRLSLCI